MELGGHRREGVGVLPLGEQRPTNGRQQQLGGDNSGRSELGQPRGELLCVGWG